MRKRDQKRMGPADINEDTKNRRRARIGLTLLGIVVLVAGLLLVIGRLDDGAGNGDRNDTAAVAESNKTETERNETEETEESEVNETPNTTGSGIVVIEPEPVLCCTRLVTSVLSYSDSSPTTLYVH